MATEIGKRNRPIHITVGGECIEQGAADILNSGFRVTFDDAVGLKRLPGDLERPVPVLTRDLIHQKSLLRVTNASEHPDTNHERIRRFETLSLTLISDITVVLSVDSVELGESSFHNFGSHIRVGVLQALRISPLQGFPTWC